MIANVSTMVTLVVAATTSGLRDGDHTNLVVAIVTGNEQHGTIGL